MMAAQARQESAGGSLSDALKHLAAKGVFNVPRPNRAPDKFGAEHDVFLAEDGMRVIKFARNFGFVPAVTDGHLIMKSATPEEYLLRHALEEQTFATGIRVEGLADESFFVISQRLIVGGHPTKNTVRKYLLSMGFVNMPACFGQGGEAWFHTAAGVLIMDTSPDNFVEAAQGIVPIDLLIAELDEALLELVGAAKALLKQAPQITT